MAVPKNPALAHRMRPPDVGRAAAGTHHRARLEHVNLDLRMLAWPPHLFLYGSLCGTPRMVLCGHAHEHRRFDSKAIIIGLGGQVNSLNAGSVQCAIETCAERDPKGLYAQAEQGEIKTLAGVNGEYAAPDKFKAHPGAGIFTKRVKKRAEPVRVKDLFPEFC